MLLGFFLFNLFLYPSITHASEKLPVLIINQIRGSESCCLPGSGELLQKINEQEKLKSLPIAHALRFDVLKNEELLKSFKELPGVQTKGALLEITPELASASGVLYKGKADGSNWHHARNAFLIGYSPDERRKLIDTYMTEFRRQFNGLPFFTVSWMIDSWSLNYLHDSYGVRVHEITKEQYETDSYTLYGGVFNLPYIASDTHPLIPQFSGDGMLMMRQTISDIDKNYGSFQSYFTSQPNDYVANPQKADVNYFKSLLDANQFALLGLENSEKLTGFHEEYVKQLHLIVDRQASGELEVVSPADYNNKYRSEALKQGPTLKSPQFPQSGAFYYFGKNYRVRMENWDGKLVLTDLRVFPSSVTDPYVEKAATVSRAYWIAPYILDSSQQFTVLEKDVKYEGNPVRRDAAVSRFGIQLTASLPTEVTQNGEVVRFKSGETAHIELTPTGIQLFSREDDISFKDPIALSLTQLLEMNTPQYVFFDRHPRFFLFPNKNAGLVQMGWENDSREPVVLGSFTKSENTWKIEVADISQTEVNSLSSIFQPDRSSLKVDLSASVFYWNNTEAISGRNPLRLYVDPRNSLDRPVIISSFSASVDNADFVVTQPEKLETLLEPFFIDITSDNSGEGLVKLTVDGAILSESTRVRFFTDCTKNIIYCATHTDELIGFGKVLFKEKKVEYEQKLKEVLLSIETELKKRLKELPRPKSSVF